MSPCLLDGFAHVAMLTEDLDRFIEFYGQLFGAEVTRREVLEPGMELAIVSIGPMAEFNVFELADNDQASRQTPMFGRGRLDHLGLRVPDLASFEIVRDRLVEHGCSDGFVTDFGPVLSIFFVDPDGLEGEVCVENPDAMPGIFHGPGHPSARYHDV